MQDFEENIIKIYIKEVGNFMWKGEIETDINGEILTVKTSNKEASTKEVFRRALIELILQELEYEGNVDHTGRNKLS